MSHAAHAAEPAALSEVEELELLAGLPPEKARAVRELLRERSELSERYRRLIETTSDAIVITDRHRRISFANPAAHVLFGFSVAELVGMHTADTVPPAMREQVSAFENAAFAGAPQRYETEIQRPDGERRTVSVSNVPLREGEEITGVVASLRDITDERRARDAVARSEARYRNLVETATDAIFTVDAQGCFTSVNEMFERTVGRTRAELLGKRFSDFLDGRQRQLAEELFGATLAGQRERAEVRYADAEGAPRTGSIMTSPVTVGGCIHGVLGIVRDVTEERLLAAQLLQHEKLAAVGQLVSGVAHELNNPLAGIMAFAQLLETSAEVTPDQRDAVATIHQEAKRAAKIVSNLLFFARQRQPERSQTDLNKVILDTLELRRYVLRTEQIDVVTDLDPALPRVWGDPFQLQQVVLNLLTNAEHALKSETGTRRITLRTARTGDRLVASVADTGRGIPADKIDQIFNPFFTTKEVGEGTGLGLSISHGIVREHGGQITVDSTPGAGATFSIALPLTAAPASDAAAAPAPSAVAARRFLVVDDEPAIRLALVRYLEKEGHAVDAVATGAEALTLLGAKRYDGILLDLRMPDLSGDEVFRALERIDPEHAARVVFTTGDVESGGAQEFLAATDRPYISKPFLLSDVAELLCRVSRR